MNCEVCGSTIYGPPKRIVIESSRLLVCSRCSSLGQPDLRREEKLVYSTRRASGSPGPARASKPTSTRLPAEVEELEIADDFPDLVRRAREKSKMSQQDLARMVKERLSIIQKIESGKMTPDLKLTHALEHVLKVRLLQPRSEPETQADRSGRPRLTISDVVQYRKKDQ
ncbi:MAG: multiprotein bridging factor aMBF1 [Candidatus Bathyarchaeia archaeon]